MKNFETSKQFKSIRSEHFTFNLIERITPTISEVCHKNGFEA